MSDTIQTAFGRRHVIRRVPRASAAAVEYVFTMPRPAAPNGEWWVIGIDDPQFYVPVASNSRGLRAALARYEEYLDRCYGV